MIHSKAIEILRTLTKEELKQFSDFVRSPFFNKNKNLIKLFDVLKKYHPDFDIENEKVYSKIYPGKEYNHNNMKKLMSEMMDISKLYLIHKSSDKNNFYCQRYLFRELMMRNLNNLFINEHSYLQNKINEGHFTDTYFEDNFLLYQLMIQYYAKNSKNSKINKIDVFKRCEFTLCSFLETFMGYLNEIFIMKFEYNMFKENTISELIFKSFDIKGFLRQVEQNNINNDYIKLICYLIIILIDSEEEKYFYKAKETITINFDNFSKTLGENLLTYFNVLLNFSSRKISISIKITCFGNCMSKM